jgi:hypothetical protein
MVGARADFGLGIVRRPAAASGLVSRGQVVEGESFGLGPGLTIANRPIRRRVALVGKLSRAECRMRAGCKPPDATVCYWPTAVGCERQVSRCGT